MRLLHLSIVAAVTAFNCAPALACSCAQPTKSASEIASEGNIVVMGVAVSENISSEPNGVVSYRFKVSHSVNAKLRDEITVTSPVSSATCGARLEVGAVSVVWLHDSKTGLYQFSSCSQIAVQHDLDGWNVILDASR